MAFEDKKCPCGNRKQTDTMLCDECNAHFADRKELSEYQDQSLRLDYRRNAAVVLVTLARDRKRK
jgi:hypothetical protein